ncbi:hypothetical protein MLD38_022383 [Melastoma candidum]|uniref:Uncharacterized protein n=1 Tax=Melastoma candidum TaxID=119954 RepID=A0ACB9QK35_9MYRT|nr:hypothetical protein MLD38_022383 [Melastoma candidum]
MLVIEKWRKGDGRCNGVELVNLFSTYQKKNLFSISRDLQNKKKLSSHSNYLILLCVDPIASPRRWMELSK